MKIAVEGCCHGQLDAIYDHISQLELKNNYKVDLLLICGDFQAVRNWRDLQCMAVPDKYKNLELFYKYYTGEKVAPIPTVIIGGNHEASNYLWELHHGGWVAPNIYFLGTAGCIQVNGLKIAGASGIYKSHDFRKGFYERLPYDKSSMRSIYHIRELTVRKLSLLSSPNIFLSHDWPNTIEQFGDVRGLLRKKTFFRDDVQSGSLGSPPLMGLLQNLKPDWWFAAHMHVRFEALVPHNPPAAAVQPFQNPLKNPDEIAMDDDFDDIGTVEVDKPMTSRVPPVNPDEITLDEEEAEVEGPPSPPPRRRETKFLALDKCVRNREFLEVVDIESPVAPIPGQHAIINFEPEWLAITRAFHPWFSTNRNQIPYPEEAEARALVEKEAEWVEKNLKRDGQGNIPVGDHQIFTMTAPGPGSEGTAKSQQPPWYINPQTVAFCRMLDIEDKVNPASLQSGSSLHGVLSPRHFGSGGGEGNIS